MKKFIAIISAFVVSAFAFSAKAQLSQIEGMPPYKLGVTVGMNNSWFSAKNYTNTLGFQIGANLMIDASELLNNTFARVEAKYSMLGAKYDIKYVNGGSFSEFENLHYIQVPVHYGYAWYINQDLSVLAETGPYVGLGLSSNHDVFGKRFDLGWGVQASLMFAKNYQVHVAYDYGFMNISQSVLQNRNLSVGFTWFFESLFE